MPSKPKPTRVDWRGDTVANPNATEPALRSINPQRRNFAIDALHADIEAKRPTENRFVRVRDEIMAHFQCSRASAERTIREAKLYLAEQFERELPTKRAEMCAQLQRIADAQEEEHPVASVAALRELSKILGFYAPKKLEVMHGASPELALQLDAILAVLNGPELAALDIVLAGIERAKREGLILQSGSGEGEPDDDIEDAVIVGSDGESGEN